jgi:pimeloyl-ACP methyl ester carboxylesterase
MKRIHFVLGAVAALAALFGINYALFSGYILGLPPEVKAALASDETVSVAVIGNGESMVMTPADRNVRAGLILYPEGRMDVRTYAPVVRRLAAEGYQVVMLSRRLEREGDLEEEYGRIEKAMVQYPDVGAWFVGGHTFGGTIGAGYALDHPEEVAGLVLWAVRLDSGALNLSGIDLPVLYVYGTLDDGNVGLMARVAPLLPPQTVIVPIEGGNRVQFGSYGPMAADVGASVTEEEQQAQAAAATLTFLAGLGY